MRAILLILLSMLAFAGYAQEVDTVETRIYFAYNSNTVDAVGVDQLLEIQGQVISIEGYASVEGSTAYNRKLAQQRANTVAAILGDGSIEIEKNTLLNGVGETSQFDSAVLAGNRVVIIKSLVVRNSTTSLEVLPADSVITTVGTVDHPEGFNCGNVVDPSIYFADTCEVVTVEDTVTATVTVVEPILPTTTVVDTVAVVETAVDTFYLPTRQAVRFYMKQGMSRDEAVSIVTGRKDQWRPLKKGDIRKPKKAKRKRLPRNTRGKNDSVWSRIFPFRGC